MRFLDKSWLYIHGIESLFKDKLEHENRQLFKVLYLLYLHLVGKDIEMKVNI
jgi:hypothetical protein